MGKSRFAGIAVLALGLSLAVSGCVMPGVCSAVGWINRVDVKLSGFAAGSVSDLQVCVAGECVDGRTMPAVEEPPTIATALPTELPTGGSSSAPSVERDWPLFSVNRLGADSFVVDVGMSAPAAITVRAIDAAGMVVGSQEAHLEWERIGGSAQCGGPMSAPAIIVVPTQS